MAHILIVDDERDVVTLLSFLLQKDGHKISEAYDGAKALELLGIDPPAARTKEELPDLVILDIMMPVIDGYTVSRRLADNAKTKKIPLLILTAKGQMRDLFAMSPSVAAYVDKPFDPKKIKELVAGILQKKP